MFNKETLIKLLEYVRCSKRPPLFENINASERFGDPVEENRYLTFCEENKLLKQKKRPDANDRKGLELTDKGLNFLFEQEKIKAEQTHSNTIKWATILIAIATVVNVLITLFK